MQGVPTTFASTFLSGAVFPSLFKQDPRYFYRGTGSKKKRILYAISNSVWCNVDNGRWQVNYSNMAGQAVNKGGDLFRHLYGRVHDVLL
jgi:hypothetical protein